MDDGSCPCCFHYVLLISCEPRQMQGGPGSVTVRARDGSSGSGFRFGRFLRKKAFSVVLSHFNRGCVSGFGCWKTVPRGPIPLALAFRFQFGSCPTLKLSATFDLGAGRVASFEPLGWGTQEFLLKVRFLSLVCCASRSLSLYLSLSLAVFFVYCLAVSSRGGKPWKTNREKKIINNEIFCSPFMSLTNREKSA